MQLKQKDLQTIHDVLKKFPYHVYLYGSRSKGTAREFSDVDLAVEEKISLQEMTLLKEAFEQSNLPFLVDIISLADTEKEFLENIQQDLIKIWPVEPTKNQTF